MPSKSIVLLHPPDCKPQSRSGPTESSVIPRHVLAARASAGIGRALCTQLSARFPNIVLSRLARNYKHLPELGTSTKDLHPHLGDPEQIKSTVEQPSLVSGPDWILIASGRLHNEEIMPERTVRELEPDHWNGRSRSIQ